VNILLTGEPRAGKTSLLQSWLEKQQNVHGFLTVEIRRENKRMGFECIASSGIRAHFADVEIESSVRIDRYSIDVPQLARFFTNVQKIPKSAELLYLDEVGQMQLLTPEFMKIANQWLDDPRPLAGTITAIFEHPFIQQVHTRHDTLVCPITDTSKDQLPGILDALKTYVTYEHSLDEAVKLTIQQMAKQYAAAQQYVYLKKLLTSAATYIAKNRIKPISHNAWGIAGHHAEHIVKSDHTKLTCDCDLFCGRKRYNQLKGDCSHIQATKLYLLLGGS